jgi:hypothetical protein
MTKPNFVLDGLFVILLIAFVACSNGTNNPEGPFVKQSTDPSDQMCGSYSLAYYKWLKAGKTYTEDESADRAEVSTIYAAVKFGTQYSAVSITGFGIQNLSILNNPLKMLDYAVTEFGNTDAELYRDETNLALNDIYTAIQTRDTQLVNTYNTKIKTGGIPALGNDQYAIVLFRVTDNNAMHWILFHKTARGLEYYDPYFGIAKKATDAQIRGTMSITAKYPHPIGKKTLCSLNSCLLLP